MPDILIRGMEMPKEGGKILITADGSVWVNAWPTRGYMRMENVYAVPLPEGHGRIGDLDKAYKDALTQVSLASASHNKEEAAMAVANVISNAPIIVPADVTDNYVGSKSEEGETDDSKL